MPIIERVHITTICDAEPGDEGDAWIADTRDEAMEEARQHGWYFIVNPDGITIAFCPYCAKNTPLFG